ncbi:hypothetical protein JMC19_002034 [Salmonella enterica]|nr:hypothetical protein [Salmonella enterica]
MQRLSLLARGTRYRWRNAELLVRFIPADAGNTRQRMRPPARSPVYPRWRGETPQNSAGTASKWRFIPAGAGNTVTLVTRFKGKPVYPRWRGEHMV